MSEIKINNIPVITENNGSVSLTTDTANIGNELTTDTANIGNNALVVNSSGNVGVGTNSPASKLVVVDGSQTIDSSDAYGYARFTHLYGNAQIGLFRSGNYVGGGYIGANSEASLIIMNESRSEQMRINSSGYVTMPYQPSFNAYLSTGQAITAGTWTKVNLNTTLWNTGSHFNTSTYRFTAPVDGIYFLSYTVNFPTAVNGYLYTGLKVNGSEIPYGNGLRVDSFYNDNTLGHGTSYKLNANDYVELWAYHDGGETLGSGAVRTHMNGILLG